MYDCISITILDIQKTHVFNFKCTYKLYNLKWIP